MNKPREQSKLEKIVKTTGRYTLASFLPRKVQDKMAEKHREDEFNYCVGSTFTEAIAGFGMLAAGIAFPPLAIPGAIVYGDSLFNLCRCILYGTRGKSAGHPITTIPYHTIKQTSKLGKYVKNKISNRGDKKV